MSKTNKLHRINNAPKIDKNERKNKSIIDKILELKQLNELCIDNQKTFGDNVFVTLGKVCAFLDKKIRNASEAIVNGKYRFVTCDIKDCLYLDEYDFEDEAIIIGSTNRSGGYTLHCVDKYSITDGNIHFKTKNGEQILTKYIYHYLYNNIKLLESGFIGTRQKKISKEFISNIEIMVPSFENQKEIVEYCENNDALIKQLETCGETSVVNVAKQRAMADEHDDICMFD